MHDNFEKEVQKKMEELNLTPSAPVWQKIELEIRPEKKRRRAIFWLFAGLLFLGGGFLMYQWNDQPAPLENTPISKAPKENDSKSNPGLPLPTANNQRKIPVPDDSLSIPTTHSSNPPAHSTVAISNRYRKTKVPNNFTLLATDPVIEKETNKSTQKEIDVVDKNQIVPSTQQPNEWKELVTTAKEKNVPATVDSIGNVKPVPADTKLTTPPVNPIQPLITIDTTRKKKIAKSQWKKQINFSIGKSSYASGSLFQGGMADAFSAPTNQSPPANVVDSHPSKIKAGLALTIGFSLSKKMSDHFDIAFGLQYSQYSTKIRVGDKRQNSTAVNSSSGTYTADEYYTNTSQNAYTNRFHAVEIPVTLSYQPSLKLPLYISLGAAYGRLLSTNALTFNKPANIFYHNKHGYTEQMLPVFASLQVELFAKRKVSLRVGPSVQYNLLKLKKENADQQHILFAGIKTAISF